MFFPWLPWPYAAKAVIQFEYTPTSLNFWITFRHPMDREDKPAHPLWVFKVDGVDKTPAFSGWRDEWSLSLSVISIPSHPARILSSYLGPDFSLRTTWHKQWEPWDRILCLDITT